MKNHSIIIFFGKATYLALIVSGLPYLYHVVVAGQWDYVIATILSIWILAFILSSATVTILSYFDRKFKKRQN